MIADNDVLEKYNTVLDKVSTDIKKECNGEPAYKNIFENQNEIVMNLQIFTIKKILRWILTIII